MVFQNVPKRMGWHYNYDNSHGPVCALAPLPQPLLYKSGQAGADLCPFGSAEIVSSSDCRAAACELGIVYDRQQNRHLKPTGCYAQPFAIHGTSTPVVSFNINPSDYWTGHGKQSPFLLCKKEVGKTTASGTFTTTASGTFTTTASGTFTTTASGTTTTSGTFTTTMKASGSGTTKITVGLVVGLGISGCVLICCVGAVCLFVVAYWKHLREAFQRPRITEEREHLMDVVNVDGFSVDQPGGVL